MFLVAVVVIVKLLFVAFFTASVKMVEVIVIGSFGNNGSVDRHPNYINVVVT